MRIEDMRLPEAGPKRDAFVGQVGADGFSLLDALAQPGVPPAAATLPVVETLRRVWARHFERDEDRKDGGLRLRPVQGRGPGDRVESPYDTKARFRAKAGTAWTGYMVHFTETCDAGAPRLVVHADTTPANVGFYAQTLEIFEAVGYRLRATNFVLGQVISADFPEDDAWRASSNSPRSAVFRDQGSAAFPKMGLCGNVRG